MIVSENNQQGQNPSPPKGVSVESWGAIARRADNAWLIDEKDDTGRVIGTAKRTDDGKKHMVRGSKRGLTMAELPGPDDGTSWENPLGICEGQTDCAAGTDLGLKMIGRPSAWGGVDYLKPLCYGLYILIFAENDDSRAGIDSAYSIARQLANAGAAEVRVVTPPDNVEDLTDWVYGGPKGADRAEIDATIKRANAIEPDQGDGHSPGLYEPYTVESLPAGLREYVEAASKAIGTDGSFIALPLLAELAVCIGTTRIVNLKQNWAELPIIWAAVIAESGTRKTPALRTALQPLKERQKREFERYNQDKKKYEYEYAQYEKDYKAWKTSNDSTEEPPTKPDPPTPVRHLVNDTTLEALAPILQANPRGVLVACDELAGWLGSMNQYKSQGGADAAYWLSMHSGEDLTVDRKSGGTIYIPQAAVSITGTIQPAVLARALGREHRENGLAARLLFAMPPRQPAYWTDNDLPKAHQDRLRRIVHALLSLTPQCDGEGDTCPVQMKLSDDAKARFVDWHDRHENELMNETGDIAAALAKMNGYVARLALVFHFARWADGESVGETIDRQSVDAAIAIVEWHKREARRLYNVLQETAEQREQRQLLDWITAQGGEVTLRMITRKGPTRYRDREKAIQALAKLAEAGYGRWIYPTPGPNGGRPSQVFQLSYDKTSAE